MELELGSPEKSVAEKALGSLLGELGELKRLIRVMGILKLNYRYSFVQAWIL